MQRIPLEITSTSIVLSIRVEMAMDPREEAAQGLALQQEPMNGWTSRLGLTVGVSESADRTTR